VLLQRQVQVVVPQAAVHWYATGSGSPLLPVAAENAALLHAHSVNAASLHAQFDAVATETVRTEEGERPRRRGGYLICDRGYLQNLNDGSAPDRTTVTHKQ
jgi:hypothetical protein